MTVCPVEAVSVTTSCCGVVFRLPRAIAAARRRWIGLVDGGLIAGECCAELLGPVRLLHEHLDHLGERRQRDVAGGEPRLLRGILELGSLEGAVALQPAGELLHRGEILRRLQDLRDQGIRVERDRCEQVVEGRRRGGCGLGGRGRSRLRGRRRGGRDSLVVRVLDHDLDLLFGHAEHDVARVREPIAEPGKGHLQGDRVLLGRQVGLHADCLERIASGIQAETEGIAALQVVAKVQSDRIRANWTDREIAGGLRGLNALGIRRHVRLDQSHRLAHGGRDLFLFLRDRLAFQAARRRLLGRRRAQLLLLDFPVRPIEALLLDAGLLLPFHADDSRLDPHVLPQLLLVRSKRLGQCGDLVLLSGKPLRKDQQNEQRQQCFHD